MSKLWAPGTCAPETYRALVKCGTHAHLPATAVSSCSPSSCGFLPKPPEIRVGAAGCGSVDRGFETPSERALRPSLLGAVTDTPHPEVNHVNPGRKPAGPAGVSVLSSRGRPPAAEPWEGCALVLAWLAGLGPESNTEGES